MKKLTRILSLALALALVVMSVNIIAVSANDDNSGLSIIIDNPNEGHTFTAYRVFKGTGSGTKPSSDVREDGTGNYLANIEFDEKISTNKKDLLIKLQNGPSDKTDLKDYGTVLGSYFKDMSDGDFTAEALGKILDKNITNDSKAARYFAYVLEDFFKTARISSTYTTSTCEEQSELKPGPKNGYKITGLPEGYYIVIDSYTGSGDVQSDYILELVGEDQIVNTKSQLPTAKKTVDSDDSAFSLGDAVPFKVVVSIPTNVELYTTGYQLKLVDKLNGFNTSTSDDDGSKFIIDSVKAYYDENGNGIVDGTEGDTNLMDPDQCFKTPTISGDVLTIEHKSATELGSSATDHWKGHGGNNIIFLYSAKIADNAVVKDTDITTGSLLTNKVHLVYSNDPNTDGTGETPDTPEAKVYTFQLNIKKTDGENPLGGADFKLYKYTNTSGTTVEDQFTELVNNETVKYSKENSDPDKEEVIDLFKFANLGEGWYRLEESTVPNGYNKKDDIFIHIESTTDANTDLTSVKFSVYGKWDAVSKTGTEEITKSSKEYNSSSSPSLSDSKGIHEITVVNNSGINLPETGGMGTKIFYTLGGILVIGAVVLLVVKRRMRTE